MLFDSRSRNGERSCIKTRRGHKSPLHPICGFIFYPLIIQTILKTTYALNNCFKYFQKLLHCINFILNAYVWGVWEYICSQVCAHVCAYACSCGEPNLLDTFFDYSPNYSLRRSSQFNPELTSWGSQPTCFRDPLFSPSKHRITGEPSYPPSICVSFRDLNSNHYTCMTNPLSTEPSPQPYTVNYHCQSVTVFNFPIKCYHRYKHTGKSTACREFSNPGLFSTL